MAVPSADNRIFKFDSKTPQRLVGAAALLVAAFTLWQILWPLRYSLLATWLVIEIIFYVFYWRPRYNELNQQPEKHEPKVVDGRKTFQRFLKFCNDLPHGVDYEGYFSGWFKGAPFKDIKRDNAEDFMAYGFWYRTRQQMHEQGLGHIPSQMVDQLEATWGIKFEHGFNSDIEFMGHLWEPINACWRPLTFYLATEAVGWFARQLLKRWGFEHHKHNGLSYFTLNVPQTKPKPATASRATSSCALADMAAGAAAAPAAGDNGHNGLPPPYKMPQAVPAAAANSNIAPSVSSSSGGSGSSSPTGSGSPTKAPSRSNSALSHTKSSPFMAGPPDWTPFAADGSANGAPSERALSAVSAASSFSAASAAAGSMSGKAGQGSFPSQGAAPQQGMVAPGLSTATSIALRGMQNPLQGALSEGLGSADTPVLFLHGVGGLPGYLEMILHVMGLGHPVITVEFRGVAMRLGKVYTADEVADSVAGILDKLNVKEACVVGHSYGTFIAGMLARHHRKRVHTLCLMDPVCFGMFMPHLLFNFLYRTPVWRGWRPHDLIEYVKDAGRLVASRDMHVCATFARRFYWSDLNLWPEDLAPGSVVLLSGKDDLMDAAEVKDMLDVAGHVKVMYNHELTHGAFLLDNEVKQAIMAEMRGLLARSGSAVVGLARPVLARTLTLMTHGFAHSTVRMKKGGANGRYYVEDHGNQLVRTFTGNLTKMLANASGVLHPHSSIARPGKSATDGGLHPLGRRAGGAGAAVGSSAGAAGMDSRGASGPGDWSANRLMQTFSGPVRRRFGGSFGASRTFGAGEQPSSISEGGVPSAAAAEGVAQDEGQREEQKGSSTAGAAGAAGGRGQQGKSRLAGGAGGGRGLLGAMRDSGVSGQPGVERIDEGDAGEEASA
ncbi:hypothetical protein OEZ85_007789 [Tetradesmus obliquus]|uniref:AB hydrolase-1 domain-containing protein n=1 Tax=Tetradesmus obliquus TaxID=3088 RepID=A0ABY8TGZ6_TETOB|nr:hypothetical protein OEZ85_007789 [Tetradesmus obliquus]